MHKRILRAFKVKVIALEAERRGNSKPIDFAIGEVAREFESMDVGLVAIRKAWEQEKNRFDGMDAEEIQSLRKRLRI